MINMQIINTPLKDAKIIIPVIYRDNRGYFFEVFQAEKFKGLEISDNFVQDNQSYSKFGTIRGLHYQVGKYAQGKLIHVITGKILDVAVDIRFGSPTYGKHFSSELSEENHKLSWIPPGFAHGFSVLSKEAIVFYKCTAIYSPKDERGIHYNDSDLAIDWKIKKPIVSDKDNNYPMFKEIKKDFIFKQL